MVADLTRGSGRFNIALGAATMIQGIGAAVSTTLAGAIIVVGGYTTAMGVLTAIAILALVLLVIGVPETAHRADGPSGRSLDPPADPRQEPVPA